MVNVLRISELIGRLAALKYFPSDPNGQTAIVQIACEMAADETQIEWLVARILVLYNDWPGPREMRACFCSKFKPRDGQECHSQIYLDGIPSEREEINRLILGTRHAQGLIEGRQESRGPMQVGIDPAVKSLARSKDLNRPVQRTTPTNPNYRPITQTEIDRAVRENRDRRAREEAGL